MSASSNPTVRPDRILEMIWGYAPPIILGTAIQHRVFDLLDAAPQTVEELAAASGNSVRGLRAILNALVGFHFLTKNPDNRYALTPESSAFLVSSKPGYLGSFAEFSGLKMIHTWLPLPEIVRDGKPSAAVNQQRTGDAFFQELVEPIFAMSYPATQAAGQALGLANAKSPLKLLDIGTGSGVWGIGLAQQSPQISVTAQDWPGVLEVTKRMAARFNLADRFKYLAGDFRDVDFGTGYNLVTIGHILHSEGVERSRQLLKKAAAAMAPKGTVVISEFLVNQDRSGPPMGLIFAVNMLAHTENGDTFSFEEISAWLKEAGLVNTRKIEPGGPVGLVLADKP
jgi:2-polyprenyl-3-methyl-5-hydroxy-6-metoxy-1,4-benzoquinol methylase